MSMYCALRGQRHSVGIKTRFSKDGSLTVTAINPGSPADGKLQLHDRIMRIDGKPLKGRSSAQIKAILEPENRLWSLRWSATSAQWSVGAAGHSPGSTAQDPDTARANRLSGRSRDHQERVQTNEMQVRARLLDGIDRVIIDLRGNEGGVFIEDCVASCSCLGASSRPCTRANLRSVCLQ